jgi:predicted AlkP superfamily phosphohydrolase/phosphomutase
MTHGRSVGWPGPFPTAAVVMVVIAALTSAACGWRSSEASDRRVIVLGFDGMDHTLAARLMAEGRLPNLSTLAAAGGFVPLATTIPPQSPVAWSSVITGLDPGAHGIFDFIHRDPATMVPYLSTTRTVAGGRSLRWGRYQFPLSGGEVELLRQGEAFWTPLSQAGVKTTILRMPANFPPSETATAELSGMGTPDLIGTYGTFSLYTSGPDALADRTIAGGNVYPIDNVDNVLSANLVGPDNPFLIEPEKVTRAFTAYVDPERAVAKIVVGSEERVLQVGEWSDWVPIAFDLIPTQGLHGMVRFYLKAVRPHFQLYVSPINVDPLDPALPISSPPSYASDLAKALGRFHTQGIAEDTKALSAGILSRDEFLAQARTVALEQERQYRHALGRFTSGLLFAYFSSIDQVSHVMWRPTDPEHPAYDAARDAPYRDVIADTYAGMDRVVGYTLERMSADTLLVVMSDHGFTTWRRAFHMNTWLEQNGYLALINPRQRAGSLFANVDWAATRAYGLGLNGLYVNVRGRERHGTVDPAGRAALAAEIATKLEQVVDSATGERAISRAWVREKAFADVRQPALTPDVVIGYAGGTRVSNQSALGEFPSEVFSDNHDEWSGDHCMDPAAVPGVLATSRPLARKVSSLEELAEAILAEFGVLDDEGRRR